MNRSLRASSALRMTALVTSDVFDPDCKVLHCQPTPVRVPDPM